VVNALSARRPEIGVCVLRVEQQDDRLLITVTISPDVVTVAEQTTSFADAGAALAMVEEFLSSFTAR